MRVLRVSYSFFIALVIVIASCREAALESYPEFDVAYDEARAHISDSIEQSINACKTAIELAEKKQSAKHLAKAYWMMGYLYSLDNQVANSIHYYDAAADVYKYLGDHENALMLMENSGSAALNSEAFDISKIKYEERLKYAVEVDADLADAQYDLALAMKGVGQMDSANHYNLLALDLAKDTTLRSDIFIELGIIQYSIERYDSARLLYERAMRIDSSPAKRFKGLNNTAQAYYKEGRLDEAVVWYRDALKQARALDSRRALIKPLNSLGICFFEQNQLDSARYYLKASVESNIDGSPLDNIQTQELGLVRATNDDLWISHSYLTKIDTTYAKRIAETLIVDRFSQLMSNYHQLQKQETVRSIQLAHANYAQDKLLVRIKRYERNRVKEAVMTSFVVGGLVLIGAVFLMNRRKSIQRREAMRKVRESLARIQA